VSQATLNRLSYRDLALRSLDQLPPFSQVLNHLMASLANEDVSFAELAAQIERDTVLSGNVLRLVNSVLYGRRGTISSVRHAVSILGINKLRNYLLGLSIAGLWAKLRTPPTWSMARFNTHSVATGLLADLLVQRIPVTYAEGAFAAGLLHDIGRLMIAIALPDEFEEILRQFANSDRSLEECERELLNTDHSELSAAALSRWNIPAPIQRAVGFHHHSEREPGAGQQDAGWLLSSAVHVANGLANHLGHGVTQIDIERAATPEQILKTEKLQSLWPAIKAEFEAEFQNIRATM